eukprot:scaffold269_cov245-Chaetoceros_neogracile.AAC.18
MVNIGKYDESYLLQRAEEIVVSKTTGSHLMDADAEAAVPRFQPRELQIGAILGKGGFCTVSEVSDITLASNLAPPSHADDNLTAHILQDRNYMAHNYLRNGKETRYAIKTLSESLMKDPERIELMNIYIVQNIIKMRAISDVSPYSRGYFLVLDRLFDTLSVRISAWKAKKSFTAGIGKVRDLRGSKKKELWIDRLMVSYDICMALKYLHDKNIVYRDLKPDNIGFDVRNTGSLRYMAPEVARRMPYNETVDIYSFAILFWQICSLEVPFASFDVNKHSEFVVHGNERPKLDRKRPDFEFVSGVLKREFSPYISEAEACGLDESSKTAKSLQNR